MGLNIRKYYYPILILRSIEVNQDVPNICKILKSIILAIKNKYLNNTITDQQHELLIISKDNEISTINKLIEYINQIVLENQIQKYITSIYISYQNYIDSEFSKIKNNILHSFIFYIENNDIVWREIIRHLSINKPSVYLYNQNFIDEKIHVKNIFDLDRVNWSTLYCPF